jgi:hypothetical protein
MVVTAKGKKATRKTSAKKIKPRHVQGGLAATLRVVEEKLKAMSPDEIRASLVKAGIIGTDGKLTANYAKSKKK